MQKGPTHVYMRVEVVCLGRSFLKTQRPISRPRHETQDLLHHLVQPRAQEACDALVAHSSRGSPTPSPIFP